MTRSPVAVFLFCNFELSLNVENARAGYWDAAQAFYSKCMEISSEDRPTDVSDSGFCMSLCYMPKSISNMVKN